MWAASLCFAFDSGIYLDFFSFLAPRVRPAFAAPCAFSRPLKNKKIKQHKSCRKNNPVLGVEKQEPMEAPLPGGDPPCWLCSPMRVMLPLLGGVIYRLRGFAGSGTGHVPWWFSSGWDSPLIRWREKHLWMRSPLENLRLPKSSPTSSCWLCWVLLETATSTFLSLVAMGELGWFRLVRGAY